VYDCIKGANGATPAIELPPVHSPSLTQGGFLVHFPLPFSVLARQQDNMEERQQGQDTCFVPEHPVSSLSSMGSCYHFGCINDYSLQYCYNHYRKTIIIIIIITITMIIITMIYVKMY
jgi:hypothetical protein